MYSNKLNNKLDIIIKEHKKKLKLDVNRARLEQAQKNHERLLIVSALIISMCFTVIIPQINRKSTSPLLKHSTLRYKILKIGFMIIVLVAIINISIIILIYGHLFNMTKQVTNFKKKKGLLSYGDYISNIKKAIQYHINQHRWMISTSHLFKLSTILLIIGLGIVLLARHHGLNYIEQIIILSSCLISVILMIYYLIQIPDGEFF